MNTTLHEVLARRASDIDSARLDIDELVGLGEQQLRRRRLTAVLGSVVAVALIVTGGIIAGSVHHQSNGPVDQPDEGKTNQTDLNKATEPVTRPIVYSGEGRDNNTIPGSSSGVGNLHVGNREVDIDQVIDIPRAWELVVTDAGAVYVQHDHTVWFTDGGSPRQLAQHACTGSSGSTLDLASGNASPLVAWIDCSPGSRGDLVVYDTSLGHEVARHQIPLCDVQRGPDGVEVGCTPEAIGDHLYLSGTRELYSSGRDHQLRLDLTSGQVIPAGAEMFAQDLRTHPRALVTGDSWQTGTPTDSMNFWLDGSRLIPVDSVDGVEWHPTQAFDTATGKPLRLHLPTGNHPEVDSPTNSPDRDYSLFEWLDDDTVALHHHDDNNGDNIITCHLSDGRCALIVERQDIVSDADRFLSPVPPGTFDWNLLR